MGRFGPYVTDGETNASLRTGEDPDTITLERAVELLTARREQWPPGKPPLPRRGRQRKQRRRPRRRKLRRNRRRNNRRRRLRSDLPEHRVYLAGRRLLASLLHQVAPAGPSTCRWSEFSIPRRPFAVRLPNAHGHIAGTSCCFAVRAGTRPCHGELSAIRCVQIKRRFGSDVATGSPKKEVGRSA